MKKFALTVGAVAVVLAGIGAVGAIAVNAQTSSVGGASGSAGGYGSAAPDFVSPAVPMRPPGDSATSGPAIIYRPYPPAPTPTPIEPPTSSGFIQFNNLTIESISASQPQAEIIASNPTVYPTPIPMMYNAATGANESSPATPPSGSAGGTSTGITCYRFDTQDSGAGTAVACPAPPTAQTSTEGEGAMSPIEAQGTNSASPNAVIAQPYPYRYAPYRIEVSASTQLMLRDRTQASLADFSSGDEINVFGYYNTDGSIQAYLIRDLSKPAESQFLQLDNVTLVSISTTSSPATLVVAQAQGYPCWGFGANGASSKQSIACPMGVRSTSEDPSTQNVTVPPVLAPTWQYLRKYAVSVDPRTVILDSNRTVLGLSDLQIGDSLNVYGNTTDNGQTISADIVRDLSIPATSQSYSGKVTQVNADGSFVIQTTDGRTITVQSPVQTGATLTVNGVLDRLSEVLSEVSSILIGSSYGKPMPVPVPLTGTSIQGKGPLPPTTSGTPNTEN